MTEQKETSLTGVIKVSGLPAEIGESILAGFKDFYEQAMEWNTKARELVVTDVSQKEEMAKAREARLALRDVRVAADKRRKEMKEDSNRYGKAVQECYNFIERMIEPTEAYLKQQEEFAERLEEERKKRVEAERLLELEKYGYIQSPGVNLAEMDELMFQRLLTGVKAEHEQAEFKKAAEEAERKLKALQDTLRNTRNTELRGLTDFCSEEDLNLDFGVIDENEWCRIVNTAKARKKEYDDEQEKIRQENERLKQEQERERAVRAKREKEMQPYVVFIRSWSDMLALPEEEYEKQLADVKIGAEEQARFDAMIRDRQSILMEIGFVYRPEQEAYVLGSLISTETMTFSDVEIKSMSSQDFDGAIIGAKMLKVRFDRQLKEYNEQKEKALQEERDKAEALRKENDRLKAEAEAEKKRKEDEERAAKKLKRAPDKVKLEAMAEYLSKTNFDIDGFKSEEAKLVVSELKERIAVVHYWLKSEIEKM